MALVTLAPGASAGPDLEVHEWGTFTSVQGADGVQVQWNPLLRTDLPSFVYDPAKLAASGCAISYFPGKAAMLARIRMETPVIYFYSPVESSVDVRVDFPHGLITEWYPRASTVGPYMTETAAEGQPGRSFLEWSGVRILAPGTTEGSGVQLAREGDGSHYYAARETAANLVWMGGGKPDAEPEYERLLFYRGAGNFQAPLDARVSADERQLALFASDPEPLHALFVLEIKGAEARYQRAKALTPSKSLSFDMSTGVYEPLSRAQARLMEEVAAALVGQGLFEQEGRAMVNTWKDQWFSEQGTRVLYLLPREWTDRTLPLTLNPAPSKLIRVMVGRSEVITPGSQRELRQDIVSFASGDQDRALAGVQRLGLGRFLEPAVTMALGANPDRQLADAAWKLAQIAVDQERQQQTKRGAELTSVAGRAPAFRTAEKNSN